MIEHILDGEEALPVTALKVAREEVENGFDDEPREALRALQRIDKELKP